MQMPSPPAAMRLRVEFLLPSMRALKKRKDHGTKRRGKRENDGKRGRGLNGRGGEGRAEQWGETKKDGHRDE